MYESRPFTLSPSPRYGHWKQDFSYIRTFLRCLLTVSDKLVQPALQCSICLLGLAVVVVCTTT